MSYLQFYMNPFSLELCEGVLGSFSKFYSHPSSQQTMRLHTIVGPFHRWGLEMAATHG